MSIDEIRKLSFDEFRSQHSAKANPADLTNDHARTFRHLTSNETIPLKVCKKIENTCGIYIGVIGGIDQVFTHLSFQKPELAILFDLNEATIDYLQIRLEILKDSRNIWEYISTLLKVRKEIDPIKLLSDVFNGKIGSIYLPGFADSMKLEKYKSFYKNGKFDQNHRLADYLDKTTSKFAHGMSKFIQSNNTTAYIASEERFKVVKTMAEEGLIKAFSGNLINYAIPKCAEILNDAAERIKTIYLSNVIQYYKAEEPQYLARAIYATLPSEAMVINGILEEIFTAQEFLEVWTR